jgi:hypothetical protein
MIKDSLVTPEFKAFIKRAAKTRGLGAYHYILTTAEKQARIDLGLEEGGGQPSIIDVMEKLQEVAETQRALAERISKETGRTVMPVPNGTHADPEFIGRTPDGRTIVAETKKPETESGTDEADAWLAFIERLEGERS